MKDFKQPNANDEHPLAYRDLRNSAQRRSLFAAVGCGGVRFAFYPKHLKQSNLSLAKDAEVLPVFIYSRIGAAELEQMPNFKLIAARSAGFDRIDLAACRSREALNRILDATVENILAFAGGKPTHVVRD